MSESTTERMRLDKWLWAARFYKTRGLANEAIAGGHVHVDGQRPKPSRDIQVGNKLEITKDQYRWEIKIIALSAQRRPASEAALLYEETPESHARRQEQVRQQREARASLQQAPEHRPNKKQRRLIHRFKREAY